MLVVEEFCACRGLFGSVEDCCESILSVVHRSVPTVDYHTLVEVFWVLAMEYVRSVMDYIFWSISAKVSLTFDVD